MGKTLGGFIAGFCIAMVLIFGSFLIYVTPQSGTIENAVQINEQVYSATHSTWFDGSVGFLNQLGGLKDLPIIGSTASKANNLSAFLIQVRLSSESLRQTLGFVKFLADISLVAIIIFIILFFIGLYHIRISAEPVHNGGTIVQKDMKRCPNCGQKNIGDAKFCENCGNKI